MEDIKEPKWSGAERIEEGGGVRDLSHDGDDDDDVDEL